VDRPLQQRTPLLSTLSRVVVDLRLRVGDLGRRVVNARVPGARRGWRPNTLAHPLDRAGAPLPEHAILPWADALGTDLDPEFGPGWRLSCAPLHDGGTVVALTCSHALADARGLIHAVDAALGELGAIDDDLPDALATASDWADARAQWSTIIGGTARALRRGIPRPQATTAHRGRPAQPQDRGVGIHGADRHRP
ncbi:hypothetical protein ACWDNR_18870, partial [Gordonia aichiensis]